MVIIFPMAGESRRFQDAGYTLPKYELPLAGQSVFRHAVRSFSHYFQSAQFLFVHRTGADVFVQAECKALGIKKFDLVEVRRTTRGQAETVQVGLEAASISDRETIAIFNIDTFRPGLRFPPLSFLMSVGGYLEVFKGSGPNWSYVRPSSEHPSRAIETSEKVQISDLCCTGLYYFQKAGDFKKCLSNDLNADAGGSSSELYVAPLYNHLIKAGTPIGYYEINREDVIFCGIPIEYENLRKTGKSRDE